MKYSTGDDVQLGDQVELWNGCIGVVVAVIDRDQYGPMHPKRDWAYLRDGVLIESDKAGLIHYLEPEKTLKLTARASS